MIPSLAGIVRVLAAVLFLWTGGGTVGAACAQSKNLAPGFEAIPKNARIAIMPTDIELFVISAGGVVEPKADWTEAATRRFRAALAQRKHALGATVVELTQREADAFEEINSLHAAVATAISLHHFGPSGFALPTSPTKSRRCSRAC